MHTQIIRDRVFDYSHSVGRQGLAGATFRLPLKVAVAQDNHAYVLNRGTEIVPIVSWNNTGAGCRIGKIDLGKAPGEEEFLTEFSGYGNGPGELIWPAGLALDSKDNVYVSDEWLNRITVFDKHGVFSHHWGTFGSTYGELNRPSGIILDSNDNLIIVDSMNHRIQTFTTRGEFISGFGKMGSSDGQFNAPWGIGSDPEGCLYIADHKNNRVQKFTSDGQHIQTIGSYGIGRGQLNLPTDVTVDEDGDIYICDWANNRIQLYSRDGVFLTSFVGHAQEVSKWAGMVINGNPDVLKRRREVDSMEPEWRLTLPTGVTFDKFNNRIIICDTQRMRLQIYNKIKGYLEPQRNL